MDFKANIKIGPSRNHAPLIFTYITNAYTGKWNFFNFIKLELLINV